MCAWGLSEYWFGKLQWLMPAYHTIAAYCVISPQGIDSSSWKQQSEQSESSRNRPYHVIPWLTQYLFDLWNQSEKKRKLNIKWENWSLHKCLWPIHIHTITGWWIISPKADFISPGEIISPVWVFIGHTVTLTRCNSLILDTKGICVSFWWV